MDGTGHKVGLRRDLGFIHATSLAITDMVGIGPFITIPLFLATMGGPQAMLGWLVGAGLAFCDGLVWAELGAAMPRAGGSYHYLREAFGRETLECPGDGFRLGLHFGRDPGGGVFDGADGVLSGDEAGEYKRDRGQQSVHRILRSRV